MTSQQTFQEGRNEKSDGVALLSYQLGLVSVLTWWTELEKESENIGHETVYYHADLKVKYMVRVGLYIKTQP